MSAPSDAITGGASRDGPAPPTSFNNKGNPMTTTTPDMPDELLPCPFCGGKAHTFQDNNLSEQTECFCVECKIGYVRESKAAAISAWNKRSDLAAPSQWRDISSCPKPSGRVLLAAKTPFGYAVQYGHWYSIKGEWVYDGYSFGNATTQPDFWMPLPQPPTLKEKI